MRRLLVAAGIVVSLLRVFVAQEMSLLPNRPGSLKFAAIGDNGTGDQPQYDVARQMEQWHQRFGFDLVIMLGDNVYGSQQPADFVRKFERPYRPLLVQTKLGAIATVVGLLPAFAAARLLSVGRFAVGEMRRR
jgi:hypothetical protein